MSYEFYTPASQREQIENRIRMIDAGEWDNTYEELDEIEHLLEECSPESLPVAYQDEMNASICVIMGQSHANGFQIVREHAEAQAFHEVLCLMMLDRRGNRGS